MKDYHKILGIERDATKSQIRSAYRKLSLLYHPDVSDSTESSTKFIEITEAYQALYYGKYPRKKHINYPQYNNPKTNSSSNTTSQKRQYNSKPKGRKKSFDEEELKKSALYNLFLVFRYILNSMVYVIGLLLLVASIYMAIVGFDNYYGLTFLFITGAMFLLIGFRNRQDLFGIGKINYRTFYFWQYEVTDKTISEEQCFYCENKKADGRAYKFNMYKTSDIKFRNNGVYNHQASHKTVNKSVFIPRSKKAQKLHSISKLIKFTSILLAFPILSFDSLFWEFIMGVTLGAIVSRLMFWFLNTKPDTYFLNNLAFTFRIFLILSVCFYFSDFTNGIYTPDYFIPMLFLVIILTDLIVDPLTTSLSTSDFLFPIKKHHQKVRNLLQKGFHLGNGSIAFSSAFQPFLKWILP